MRRRIADLAALVTLVAVSAAGCADDPEPTVDPAAYRAAVEEICTATIAAQGQLVEPVDAAGVAPFADDVAALLEAEAELLRAVQPPAELAADHRAFVQNTDDQAGRWAALATTPTGDTAAFGAVRTELLQLGLGRDDLAVEMGVDRCRRQDS